MLVQRCLSCLTTNRQALAIGRQVTAIGRQVTAIGLGWGNTVAFRLVVKLLKNHRFVPKVNAIGLTPNR